MSPQKTRTFSASESLQFRTIRRPCEGSTLSASQQVLGWMLCLLGFFVLLAGTARAQGGGFGPNLSEPDSSLVMPLVASEGFTSYFAVSNVGASGGSESAGTFPEPIPILWEFYDESGELVLDVTRTVLGEGGTDIVSPASVRSKDAQGRLGQATDLTGTRGFVVVSAGDDEPRLIGNFTVANIAAQSAWGAAAAGLGTNGLLIAGDAALGTTFSIDSLGDDMLIVLGVDDLGFVPTSLTWGDAPEPGEELLELEISLHTNNGFDAGTDEATVKLDASAYFTRIGEVLPNADRSISGTISVRPTDSDITILGFYGQAVGTYGAGQVLRMVPSE